MKKRVFRMSFAYFERDYDSIEEVFDALNSLRIDVVDIEENEVVALIEKGSFGTMPRQKKGNR
jgi:hypothetical protein